MLGKFAIDRQLLNHDLWISEKFTRGQAWVDLIGLANHQAGYIRVRGIKIDLQRGDVGWGITKLCSRWQRSKKWVNGFLEELKDNGMILLKKSPQIFTVITIQNYNIYQWESPQSNPQRVHKVTTNNNDNKVLDTKVSKEGVNPHREEIDFILNAFRESFEQFPIDKQPRRVAWNYLRMMKSYLEKVDNNSTWQKMVTASFSFYKERFPTVTVLRLDTLRLYTKSVIDTKLYKLNQKKVYGIPAKVE